MIFLYREVFNKITRWNIIFIDFIDTTYMYTWLGINYFSNYIYLLLNLNRTIRHLLSRIFWQEKICFDLCSTTNRSHHVPESVNINNVKVLSTSAMVKLILNFKNLYRLKNIPVFNGQLSYIHYLLLTHTLWSIVTYFQPMITTDSKLSK